jgi:hypothetical protein
VSRAYFALMASGDAHGGRNQGDVEHEGHHAVRGYRSADGPRGYRHVGDLRRRADGEVEIEKVPIVWFGIAGAGRRLAAMLG